MITILLILIRTVEFEILGWTLFSKFWHVIGFMLNRVILSWTYIQLLSIIPIPLR